MKFNVDDFTSSDDDLCCSEEDLIAVAMEDEFSYQIRERGEDYYYSDRVISCYKNKHEYFAKVKGKYKEFYNVHVNFEKGEIKLDCDCPCDFPCKHEYAVLICIENEEYETIDLKPEIVKKKINMCNLIKNIPAEEIKEYLLSSKISYGYFDRDSFEEYFFKYLPKQDYEYYYNGLYNSLVLDGDYEKLVDNYLDIVRRYIVSKDFYYGFVVVKSIIEAFNDSKNINSNNCINIRFSMIGLLLRVICRKVNGDKKQEILDWIVSVENNNYYDNVYLEDIILMIK